MSVLLELKFIQNHIKTWVTNFPYPHQCEHIGDFTDIIVIENLTSHEFQGLSHVSSEDWVLDVRYL